MHVRSTDEKLKYLYAKLRDTNIKESDITVGTLYFAVQCVDKHQQNQVYQILTATWHISFVYVDTTTRKDWNAIRLSVSGRFSDQFNLTAVSDYITDVDHSATTEVKPTILQTRTQMQEWAELQCPVCNTWCKPHNTTIHGASPVDYYRCTCGYEFAAIGDVLVAPFSHNS